MNSSVSLSVLLFPLVYGELTEPELYRLIVGHKKKTVWFFFLFVLFFFFFFKWYYLLSSTLRRSVQGAAVALWTPPL